MLDKESNDRLNSVVRDDYDCPDWEDVNWKIWKQNNNGEYWYIPESDDEPSDDNIIEGNSGEMLYMDADDARIQWGDYEDSNYAASAENLKDALRAMCADADETGREYLISDGASDWDLDCLEDAIDEGNRDCFDRYGDLGEPEDYAYCNQAGVSKWENGSWGCPIYRITYREN